MLKTTFIVFLSMAMLAIATHPESSETTVNDKSLSKKQLEAIVKDIERINKLDCTLIETLINDRQQILAKKEVVAGGTVEIEETVVFCKGKVVDRKSLLKLITFLSKNDWEYIEQFLNEYSSTIVNEMEAQGENPLNIADAVTRAKLSKSVNWTEYLESFKAVTHHMTPIKNAIPVDQGALSGSANKCLPSTGKMNEIDEALEKLTQSLDNMQNMRKKVLDHNKSS